MLLFIFVTKVDFPFYRHTQHVAEHGGYSTGEVSAVFNSIFVVFNEPQLYFHNHALWTVWGGGGDQNKFSFRSGNFPFHYSLLSKELKLSIILTSFRFQPLTLHVCNPPIVMSPLTRKHEKATRVKSLPTLSSMSLSSVQRSVCPVVMFSSPTGKLLATNEVVTTEPQRYSHFSTEIIAEHS